MLGIITKQLKNGYRNNIWMKRSLVRNYRGGMPGCNLPFRIDNPYRFMAVFLVAGVSGFGAPFLVVMHQMLRPYDYE